MLISNKTCIKCTKKHIKTLKNTKNSQIKTEFFPFFSLRYNGLTQQPIEAYTSASSYSVLATPSDGATGWIQGLRHDKKTIKLAIKVTGGSYTDGTVSWFIIGW